MHTQQPSFWIANIPVHGRCMLAPMDGISDATFRGLTRRLGSALSISEFINCIDYLTHKDVHAHRFSFAAHEHPFGVQLLDNDPERIAQVASHINALIHPDFFDLNLGCPVRTVTSRGAGAGLMRTPDLIKSILTALKSAVPTPLTAKIRLGWDEDNLNYLEIGQLLVECGVSMLALHARTAKMAYRGKASWQPIAELKAALPIPMIGNGDVKTPADAMHMLEQTGCDAVMVGRGAMANPWIFSARKREDVSPAEVHAFMLAQLDGMLATYTKGALRAFRKFAKAYLTPYALPKTQLRALLTTDDVQTFKTMLSDMFLEIEEQLVP